MSTLYHDPIPNAPGIYRITCTSNGKIYVGSAINLCERWREHRKRLRRGDHVNKKLQNAWNKYGEQSFTFEVLDLVLTPELLTAREQYWFDTLKPFGRKGFNIATTAGSSLGLKHTPEARQKIKAARAIQLPHTPEAREKLRIANLGNTRLLGHKHSEEARRKMSKSQTGRTHSAETKEKIRIAHIGHKHTPEAIEKMRASHAIVSAETRAKLSASLTGRITSRMKTFIITAPDGTEYIIQNMAKFCKDYHLDSSALIKVAKGRYNHYKGWKARYLE